MRKSKILILLLIGALVLGVVGCSSNNAGTLGDGKVNPNGLNPYSADRNDLSNRLSRDDRIANRYNDRSKDLYEMETDNSGYKMNMSNGNYNVDSQKMANSCERIKGVDDASCVIANGKAYVALDLGDNVQSTDAERIERECSKKLQKYGKNYSINITSDEDYFGKLRDIGDGIRNGSPLSDFEKDFGDFDNNFNAIRLK